MAETESLPDLKALLGELVTRVDAAEQPFLLALAERLAAGRYRRWASEETDADRVSVLEQCAEREDEIARRIESLYPNPAQVRRSVEAAVPEFADLDRTVFGGRPLEEQYALQAVGERLGAATWRAMAAAAANDATRDTLASCAPLEEANADALDALLA